MKNLKIRARSAIILFSILIPLLILTYFVKSLGVAIYMFFSAWALYEVISHNQNKRSVNLVISLLSTLIWIIPINWFLKDWGTFWEMYSNGHWVYGLDRETLISIIKNTIFFKSNAWSGAPGLGLILVFLITTFLLIVDVKSQKNAKNWFKNYFITIFAVIFIPSSFKLIFMYNVMSLYWLFILFLIPIVCDSFAYLIGRLIGRKIIKFGFAPHISPKKSWEGAIAGYFIGALFVFIFMGINFGNSDSIKILINQKQIITAVFVLPAISIIGDLVFSGIKRAQNIKDFSELIAGHGGIMDRFDSLSFNTVFLTFILMI
ncbi:phosphatidate cytidylyltransferase [Mycoplasma hominis]|uniref:phosphatidate cytidylyltransferase n=1 Tax=Metamycoplasma hominis TaxID=2098 RepID=UPI0017470ED8|nr:phosphatidate cytidylyltransferase [Metamycoplasma hominis]MBD3898792.1 phosphatidate cytidylyltransferase [Metamycoplasma hominis]